MRPARRCGQRGVYDGGDVLEVPHYGVAGCVAASTETSTVHCVGGDPLVQQRVDEGVKVV